MARACTKNIFARMNKRVAIQAVTQTSDGQGGADEAWVTLSTVAAEIVPVGNYERMEAMKLASPVSHKVTMRYYSGLTTKHRLLYGTRVLKIKEVVNKDEDNAIHQLRCIEG